MSHMVSLWAWGFFSPQILQHSMALLKHDLKQASSEEGLSLQFIDILADLGAGGTVPGNCHRDLIRRMPGSKMPRTMHPVMVPLQSKLTQEYEQSLDMLLPHVLFSHLYHFYRDAFFTYLVPSAERLKDFWESVSGWLL